MDDSEGEKYFCSMTRTEEENWAARIIRRGWRWTRKRIILKEMQATLKAEEEEWRKLLNKELASLELDLHPFRTTESELTTSSGVSTFEVGEARPPRGEKYRATESELAEVFW